MARTILYSTPFAEEHYEWKTSGYFAWSTGILSSDLTNPRCGI
jgi:hypothetical protein